MKKTTVIGGVFLCISVLASFAMTKNLEPSSMKEPETTPHSTCDAISEESIAPKDSVQANEGSDSYYDKTKESGAAAARAIADAVHSAKRRLVNGEEDAQVKETAEAALRTSGETIVEATKATGRLIEKEAPVIADSIVSISKRLKEAFINW